VQLVDALDARLPDLDRYLRSYARRQPGCQALQAHYGIGPLTAVALIAELGSRRFSSSRQIVRYAGMPPVSPRTTRTAVGAV